MRKQLLIFAFRWLLNSAGLWIAVKIFGTGYDISEIDEPTGAGVFLLAGLIFSIVNSLLRPIVVILSLPAILVTLGLFTFVVNGFMVYISLQLSPGIQMTFLYSILTGIILSLINYVVSSVLELHYDTHRVKEQQE